MVSIHLLLISSDQRWAHAAKANAQLKWAQDSKERAPKGDGSWQRARS